MKNSLIFLSCLLAFGLSAQVYDTIPSITFENQDDIDSFSSQYPFENIIVDGDVRLRANTNYENTDSLYNIVEIRGDFFADAMGDFPGRLNGSISLPKLKYVNEFRPPSGTYSLDLPMLHTANIIELGLRYWNPDLTYLPVTLTELNISSLTTVESFICQRLTMSNDTLVLPMQLDSVGVLNLHGTTLKSLLIKDSFQFDLLRLNFNHDLITCKIPAFCAHASSGKAMLLSDNSPGCNSRSIIEELCNPTSDCPPDSTYSVCKQQDVDHFIVNYPNCDKLKNLILRNPSHCDALSYYSGSINNLAGFKNIKEVTNNLNALRFLDNFIGLDSLVKIGGEFETYGLGSQGLEQLEYIENFNIYYISDNSEFQLPSLKYCKTIYCDVLDNENASLSIPNLLEINTLDLLFIEDLEIRDELLINNQLSIKNTNISPCEYPAVCNFIKTNSNYDITDNNENCSGSEDVIAICNASDFDSDGSTFDVDCDDLNPSSYPGAVEILDNDIDEDCDGYANTGIDEDMDGYDTSQDCDDLDPLVNPTAEEIINNDIDENCDGLIEIDMDLDGFLMEHDCDDLDPLVNPTAEEIINNDIDENCDGLIEIDMDLDGFLMEDDCDDLDSLVNPNGIEVINNDIDENCDGLIEIDMDLDGFLVEEDCDDLNAMVNPDMDEILFNGLDDDCRSITSDTILNCLVGSIEISNQQEYDEFRQAYKDCNVIIFGDLNSSFSQEAFGLEMVVSIRGDLNIRNKAYVEFPNLLDVDRANFTNQIRTLNLGRLREVEKLELYNTNINTFSLPETEKIEFLFINGNDELTEIQMADFLIITNHLSIRDNENLSSCSIVPICNYLLDGGSTFFLNNKASCNTAPQILANCSNVDFDNDGFAASEDCNDLDPSINPEATEIIDNDIDEDCDGFANTSVDEDMDGYDTSQDCNDLDPFVNPASEEIINNDIDENCDGIIEIDMDLDGFLTEDDCDDSDQLVNPGMEEILYNGIDDDCNHLTLDTITTCISGTISLINQQQYDDFREMYQNCNLTIDGDLRSSFSQEIFSLEMIVSVTGELDISNKQNIIMPNLQIVERANLRNASIMNLNGLLESGFLEIRNTDLQSLELDELKKVDRLLLSDNTQLTELLLNDSLVITDFLDISFNTNLSNCSMLPICNYLQSGGSANIISNSMNCGAESEILSNCITSTNDFKVSQLKIFPNPAKDLIFLESDFEGRMHLFNIYGERVFNSKLEKGRQVMNFATFNSGVYFLEVLKKQRVSVHRIVIKKN